MIINLPYKLELRPYQQEIYDAFFVDKYRYMILILPRRHGKDRTTFNIMVAAAMQKVGLYFYAFPNRTQARTAIWEGIMPDGTKFLDHIPKELLKSVNNTELKATLINGSMIKLVGMDYYNNYVGTNALGIAFSEFAVGNPMGFKLMQPVLRQNGGWAIFPYTPRGHNHGYDLYMRNKNNPKWFVMHKTVEECLDENGVRYLSAEDVEEDRNSIMSDNLILREYYCDFEAPLDGAIFSLQIKKAYEENRICDFLIDTSSPVYTFWDLGYNDSTSVWFMQIDEQLGSFNMIYYYESVEVSIDVDIREVNKIREKLGIVFGGHYAPHDGNHHQKQTGLTTVEYARKFGMYFIVVPKIQKKMHAIEAARLKFSKVKIHETNCEQGINCLKSYVKVLNQTTGEFGAPKHNFASHGSDAFMTFACAQNVGYSSFETTVNYESVSF